MRSWVAANREKARASAKRTRDKRKHLKAISDKAYVAANRDRIRERKKKWEEANRDRLKALHRAWYQANKERMAELARKRAEALRAADPEGYKRTLADRARKRRRTSLKRPLHDRTSALVRSTLKRKGGLATKGGRSWTALLEYTAAELKDRLELTMPHGYSWEDYLAGRLELDHIRPASTFSFRTADDPEFRACWALENLQLLTAEDNYRKRATWTDPADRAQPSEALRC